MDIMELNEQSLQEIKSELRGISEELSLSNVKNMVDKLNYLSVLLSFGAKELEKKEQEEKQAHEVTNNIVSLFEEEGIAAGPLKEEPRYSFDLAYREDCYWIAETIDGFFAIPLSEDESRDEIKIPETIIRNIGAVDGSVVFIKEKYNTAYGFPYYLTLVGYEEKDPTVVTLSKMIVEKNECGYFLISDHSGFISLNEPIFLDPGLLKHKKIEEGDVIDVRYELENPTHVNINWKHKESEINYFQKLKDDRFTILDSTSKTKRRESKKPKKNELQENMLVENIEGLTVTVVGMEALAPEFKQIIEKQGGTFYSFDKKSPSAEQINTAVRKSDIVVLALSHVSHAQTMGFVRACKKAGVTYTSFNGFSKLQFVENVRLGVSRFLEAM